MDFYKYESLVSQQNKKEKGVVYTPGFIVEYILSQTLSDCNWHTRVIDPACGTGIFLFGALEKIHADTGKPINEIIEDNIWGVDNDPEVVAITTEALKAYSLEKCGVAPNRLNIFHGDSTQKTFLKKLGKFDVVVGNPPYVRIQNIPTEARKYLADWMFVSGDSDLYIVFMELGFEILNKGGWLGYITPNSWFRNKSSRELLEFIVENGLAREIIDFEDVQIFGNKAQTYTSILIAKPEATKTVTIKKPTTTFKFKLDDGCPDMEDLCSDVKTYEEFHYKNLTVHTTKNDWIDKIENVGKKLKNSYKIRVGLATLADSVFFLSDWDEFEPEALKPCIKVSRLKDESDIERDKKFIIYPYRIVGGKAVPYTEVEMWRKFPKTTAYLYSKKVKLDERDKGKSGPWWLYGRTQGLTSLFGKKLLMPPMVKSPRFIMCQDEDLLYLSGYAIFGERLNVLKAVLESQVFKEYVAINGKDFQGGWKGCSKHTIEDFSVPEILVEEEAELFSDTDNFLSKKYGI